MCGQVSTIAYSSEALTEDVRKPSNLQSAMACLVPPSTWNTSLSQVVWQVKFSGKGLTPIRPVVVFNESFDLESGQWLQLV